MAKSAGYTGTEAQFNAALAAMQNSPFLPLSGGTLTGNLTGKYITGTWLQATAAADLGAAATKIAVFDGSGWLYYRTPAQIRSDGGGAPLASPHIYRDTESASVSHRLYHCKASQYSGRHGGFDSGSST